MVDGVDMEAMMASFRKGWIAKLYRDAAKFLGRTWREGTLEAMDEAGLKAIERSIADARQADEEERQRIVAETARAARRAEIDEALKRLAKETPTRYLGASLDDFTMGKTPLSAERASLISGESRLLIGTAGIGKTRLAWALMRHWTEKGETCRVVKAQELLSEMKALQAKGIDTYGEIRNRYGRDLQHLVIDEIDKIYGTQADYMLLSFLIDIRYEEMLQTVVMGNRPKDRTVEELLGSAPFSRLSGDGAEARYVVGKDMRREG